MTNKNQTAGQKQTNPANDAIDGNRNPEIDDLSIDDSRQNEIKGGVGIIQKAGGGN